MLRKLLNFERGLQIRQIGFWVVIITMFILGALTPWLPEIFGSDLAGEKIKANGAQMIAGSVASWDIAAIFFAAIFVVTGILRDKTHNMMEIIHATPVSTFDMTSSRMIGIYLTVLACIIANTFGQFAGQFNPQIDKEILGPINPIFYFQPMILFTVVNALVVTAFFTLIAGITQNRMFVFVSAIGLFFFSIMSGILTELDVPKWLQAIVDPFANIAYALDTEFWSVEDRNTKLVPLSGYIGLNRLVWSIISLVTLVSVFKQFKRGLISGQTKLVKQGIIQTIPVSSYQPARTSSGLQSDLAALIMRVKFEYFSTVKSVPFIIMAALAAALFAFLTIVTVFFAPQKLVPTSLFMVSLGFTSFLIPVVLIIAFFSGEIIWRDKTIKFTELLDSTAIKNWPLLLGKWLALSGVLVTLCLVGILIGMIVQVIGGGPSINLALYFKYTFLNVLPNYLALAFLALFVQSFTPNRIVGMLAAAAAMAFFTFIITRLSFYHPVMGFTGTSPGQISEISPYNNWISFRWFNLYFGALCAVFAIISTWMWRRGLQTSLINRFKKIKTEVTPISGGLAMLFLAIFIGSGTHIYKAYDKAEWKNKKAVEKAQAKTEILLVDKAWMKLPKTQSVSITADIYPAKQEAVIGGTFRMKNTWDEPISEVYVRPASRRDKDIRLMEFSGATRITDGGNSDGDKISDIEETGHWMFRFDPPLAPNAESTFTFETFFHASRLADPSSISKNGTFLNNYGTFQTSPRAIPIIGVQYDPITNPDKRRKYKLGDLPKFPERTDMNARQIPFFGGAGDYIDFEADVCTSEKQIPIAPGNYISETIVDGRRCRRYQSKTKFANFYSILSADFAETKDSWTSPTGKVIPITIYHGEDHTYSIADIMDGIKFGLSHYTNKFGPYQFNYVRVMEVPFITFAQAFAGTIPYAERGFIMDSGNPNDDKTLDNAKQTTLHEMAHQWFGHQIVPAATRGYNVQSEGLTSYAALDAYEAKYGWDKARYALEKVTIEPIPAMMFIDRKKEEPLSLASDQQYLVYNKADWVMWSLKHYIGKEKMHAVMQKYLQDFGQKGPPYPTTLELISYLKDAAGPDFHQLIEDQWNRITYWELSYGEGDVKITQNQDGTYLVEIPFEIDKKISSEEKPKQVSVTEIDGEELREWVEIGFYENAPKEKWSAWTALERIQATQENSILSFTVKERPYYIALDPRRLLQERNVTDNVKELPKKLASAE